MLNLSTWKWETRSSFPSEISDAPTIYVGTRFFLFGGYNGSTRLSRIAAYDPTNDEWTSEGHLLTPRSSSGVITVDNSFIIVGGYMSGQQSSEKKRDTIECIG